MLNGDGDGEYEIVAFLTGFLFFGIDFAVDGIACFFFGEKGVFEVDGDDMVNGQWSEGSSDRT